MTASSSHSSMHVLVTIMLLFSILIVLSKSESPDIPKPTIWPEQFHSILMMNYSGELELIDLWYDWPNGRNFNIIQSQLGKLKYDLEWNNGTSFFYTLDSNRECSSAQLEVGILRPNWLDGATYVGQRHVDGFLCYVWEKANFITYYEDVFTRRPVHWVFYTDLGSSFWGMLLIVASTNLLTARIAAGCLAVALLIVLFIAKNWTLRGLCIGFIIFIDVVWILQEKTTVRILRYVIVFIGVFFIDGPGGIGKTFLYKALLAQVRSRGLIALATASSGAAANNMPGGRTAHSRFKIPLNLNNNSMCNIRKQSGVAELLRSSKIIIWDEASMAKRQTIEAVDRTLQDIIGVRLPFGGNIMVLGGDFRQVLPVIKRGTRAQIVDSSLRMSPLWSLIKKMRLTINMRALTDPWFSYFLLRVGDGNEESIEGSFIRIPDDMTISYINRENSKRDLIDAIFPSMQNNEYCSDYIISRAILSTKNVSVDEINDLMIDNFHGEEKVYYSFDEAEDDHNNFYPIEFLNSLTVSGLPPHKLRLKIGCPVILLRNIDPSHGLCNDTRLICKGFQHNVIDAEIAVGQHIGKRVFLPKIPLCPSDDDMFPFKLKRKQFPIRLNFAMTINKAQGQTIPHVGVYLPDFVFSHGQLYVALSRGISRENTKILVMPAKDFKRDGVYTSNVVYREVLRD